MGFLFAFLAAFAASSKDILSKQLAFSVSGSVSAFGSFVFALPFYLVLLSVLYYLGLESFAVSAAFLGFVFIRALTDTVAEWSKMTAFSHGDIGLVACFFNLSPLFMIFTSPIITGDELSPLGIVALLVIVAGTMLLVPRKTVGAAESLRSQRKAILWALCAAFFFSLNSCFDRLAALSASAPLSAFAVTIIPVFLMFPFIAWRGSASSAFVRHWQVFFARGALETVFMVLKLFAMQHMQAPYVSGVQKFSLVFSILAGRFLFGERETGRRLVAAAVILLGVILVIGAELVGR